MNHQIGLGEQLVDAGEWLFRASGEKIRLTQEGKPIPNSSHVYDNAFVSELNEQEDLLMSNGSFNSRELWLLDHRQFDQPQPIALPGDIVQVGDEQVTVVAIGEARMNNRGRILGEGGFRTESGNRFEAVWQLEDQLNIIARSGQPAPTITGFAYERFIGLRVNDQGDLAFSAGLVNDSDGRINSIWKQVGDELQLVADSNTKLPGLNENDRIFNLGHPALNERGQIAFEVSYGESIDSKLGIWVQDVDGEIIPVAVPDMEYLLPNGEPVTFGGMNGVMGLQQFRSPGVSRPYGRR